jgi:uncharacterized membrane protein
MTNYQVKIKIDGIGNSQTGPVELAKNERWEEIVSFTPSKAGDNQVVEFLLFKNGENEPYRDASLEVDVKE